MFTTREDSVSEGKCSFVRKSVQLVIIMKTQTYLLNLQLDFLVKTRVLGEFPVKGVLESGKSRDRIHDTRGPTERKASEKDISEARLSERTHRMG